MAARLSLEGFVEYVRVVNYRTQHEVDVDALLETFSAHSDGFYYVVQDGHSRAVAIINNEMRRSEIALTSGFITDPLEAEIKMIVDDFPTPEEIMIRQITGNFHSRPATEHVASDILSLRKYKQAVDPEFTNKDFISMFNGELPPSTLQTVLEFGNLPEDIQEEVFEDARFPFTIAAKIGSLAGPKRQLTRMKLYGEIDPTPDEERAIEETVSLYLKQYFISISNLMGHNKKMGVNLIVKRIDNERKLLIESFGNEGNSLFGTELEDWGMTPELLRHEEIVKLRRLANQAIDDVIQHPVTETNRAVASYKRLLGEDTNPTSLRAQRLHLSKAIAPVLEELSHETLLPASEGAQSDDEMEIDFEDSDVWGQPPGTWANAPKL